MFTFLIVLAGAAAGCGVCAFGMWAFFKGQSAAIVVGRGGLPKSGAGRRMGGNTKDREGTPDLSEQFGSMFGTGRGG